MNVNLYPELKIYRCPSCHRDLGFTLKNLENPMNFRHFPEGSEEICTTPIQLAEIWTDRAQIEMILDADLI